MPVKCYVTLGGKKCLDPYAVRGELARLGLPIPGDLRKCNGYQCQRGREPGVAYVLLSKTDVDSFGSNLPNGDLLFYHGDTTRTIKTLRTIDARCISNADAAQDIAVYLVKLADPRYFSRWTRHTKAYNVRTAVPTSQWAAGTPAATLFAVESLDAGSVWTWARMLENIWSDLNAAGTSPALPYTPTGAPENYRFYGVNAWNAYHDILDKLNCSLIYKPELNTYEIVNNGDTQAGLADFISDNAAQIVREENPKDVSIAYIPANVQILFPKRAQHYGTADDAKRSSTFYADRYYTYGSIASVDFGITSPIAGSASIWDDMPAIYGPTGTHLNATECNARGAQLAEWFFKSRQKLSNQKKRVYSGALSIRPGAEISHVTWRHDGRRLTTTIETRPAEFYGAFSYAGETSKAAQNLMMNDEARNTLDTFPQVMQWIRPVEDSTGSNISTPNASGFYAGQIMRAYPTATPDTLFATQDDCFFVFSNGHNNAIVANNGNADDSLIRMLGRQAGVVTTTPTGGSSGTRPLYVVEFPGAAIYHGTAKANWKKQTAGDGNWPSRSGEIGYVEVDNVLGLSTATEFRVWIPTLVTGVGSGAYGDGDPNVVSGQPVTFIQVPGKADLLDADKPYYEVCGDGYVSATIGTVVGFFDLEETPTGMPIGWELCDTDGTPGDINADMTDYIPLGNKPSDETTDGDLTITIPDDDVAAALDGHLANALDVDASVNPIHNVAVEHSTGQGNHVGSGTDITVSIPWADRKPKTRGMYWRVRYDNAAN